MNEQHIFYRNLESVKVILIICMSQKLNALSDWITYTLHILRIKYNILSYSFVPHWLYQREIKSHNEITLISLQRRLLLINLLNNPENISTCN